MVGMTMASTAPKPRRPAITDARWLGVALMPIEDLLRDVVGRNTDDNDITELARAIRLTGPAQRAALMAHPNGLRVIAALELAARSHALQRGRSRRIFGPVDVASLFGAPLHPWARIHGDHPDHADGSQAFLLSLDVRLSLARLEPIAIGQDGSIDATQALMVVLGAGCCRAVLVRVVPRPAVVTPAEVDGVSRLQQQSALVGVMILDGVWVGDDGWLSLRRLGLCAGPDNRYR
jgi:hypothetical protein